MPPLPKTCPKLVSVPEGGAAFLRKAFLQKKFSGAGEDSAVGASVRLLRVTDRVRDVPVTEVGLDRAGVDAVHQRAKGSSTRSGTKFPNRPGLDCRRPRMARCVPAWLKRGTANNSIH